MSNIVNTIKELEDFQALKGVSKDDINSAEEELGLKFAPEYKEYLIEFGIASGNGHELTGLVDSPLVNVVQVTKKAKATNKNIPEDLYVIEDPAIDKVLIWQNSKGELFKTIKDSIPEKINFEFVDYIKQ